MEDLRTTSLVPILLERRPESSDINNSPGASSTPPQYNRAQFEGSLSTTPTWFSSHPGHEGALGAIWPLLRLAASIAASSRIESGSIVFGRLFTTANQAGRITTAAPSRQPQADGVHVSIELEDLTSGPSGSAHEGDTRHRRQRERRYRELLRREAMKFSHSVQFNAVPEWSSHYINYSNLKKL